MYSSEQPKSVNVDLKGVSTFKMLILAFIVLTGLSVVTYLFSPLLSSILYVVGSLALVLGIFLVSSSNDHLGRNLGVIFLFLFAVLSVLLVAFLNSMFPHNINVTSSIGPIYSQLGVVNSNFGFNIFIIAALVLSAGSFMALGANAFSGWLDKATGHDNKTFTYFGVLFFVGEVIVFTGYVVLVAALNEILSGTHGLNTETVAFSQLIITIGTIFLLVSFLLEILAGWKVFKLLSS